MGCEQITLIFVDLMRGTNKGGKKASLVRTNIIHPTRSLFDMISKVGDDAGLNRVLV